MTVPDAASAAVIEAAALCEQGRAQQARELLVQARQAGASSPELHFNLGIYCGALGDPAAAAASFEEAVRSRPDWGDAHVYLVANTLQAGDIDRALALLDDAFSIAPDNVYLHEQFAVAMERKLAREREQGRAAPLEQALGYVQSAAAHLKAMSAVPQASAQAAQVRRHVEMLSRARGAIEMAESSLAAEVGMAFNRVRPAGSARRFPGYMILTTMPKSGSEYVWMALTTGLNLRPARISGAVTVGVIEKERIEQVSKGGFIAHGHMHCTPVNRVLLAAYTDRLVVHVRDPRQALISWVHYQDHRDVTSLPSSWEWGKTAEWRFRTQMDHFIDRFYADQLEFLRSWMDADADEGFAPRILFARQEDLREDPDGYFRRILEFFEIEPELFRFPEPPKKGERHYRRGETDEWRQVLQPRDIERMQSLLPDDMLAKFGWQR